MLTGRPDLDTAQPALTEARHERLCQDLWTVLVSLKPGDRFLSVRAIMRDYGVSQGTATKALDRFCREGLLDRHLNLGFTVSDLVPDLADTEALRLLVLAPDWPSSDVSILHKAVHQERNRSAPGHLHLHEYSTRDGVPSRLPLIGNDADGVIVLPASGITVTEARNLAAYDTPVVVIGCDMTGMGIASVCVDNSLAGNMAAHHLHQLGHRRIGVVISEPHNRTIMDRTRGVVNYLSLQAGVTCDIIDCDVRNGDMATERTYHRFLELLEKPSDLTAVVSVSIDPIQGIFNACAKRGISVPNDLSVIGIGSDAIAQACFPPLTTVAIHFELQVERAIALMRAGPDRIDAGQCYSIAPSLIVRASTAPTLENPPCTPSPPC